VIVTTAVQAGPGLVELAERVAQELGAIYVPRSRDTLRRLARKHGSGGILVASAAGLRYVSEGMPPLFFHPNMALIRVKRLVRGGSDNMLSISGVEPGDTVLDCTAGLGSDAIVFSYAVGESGKVIALEASPLLYTVVREGLRSADTGSPEADAACRRVELVHADHSDFLRSVPDKSVDAVYFDPMFERPVVTSSSLRPVRSHAKREPISPDTIHDAVRVARKSVVLKNSSDSGEFDRLGFVRERSTSSAVAYGVIRVEPVR
jgi:16S rRNA (guanine1516-N2)-methyltransferase